jgi:hypothetical protein
MGPTGMNLPDSLEQRQSRTSRLAHEALRDRRVKGSLQERRSLARRWGRARAACYGLVPPRRRRYMILAAAWISVGRTFLRRSSSPVFLDFASFKIQIPVVVLLKMAFRTSAVISLLASGAFAALYDNVTKYNHTCAIGIRSVNRV